MKRIIGGMGVLLVGIGALWWWLPRGQRPALGPQGGRLADCPDSPNCACSEAGDEGHRVEALGLAGDPVAAQARLKALLDGLPGMRFVDERPGYLRYEAVTPVWRFVDDVEFLVDAPRSRIQVRSASRIGHSDLGANRRRLEAIRRLWQSGPG